MSKYTRENPFEFEGVKIWRDSCGLVETYGWRSNMAHAIAAFVTAEAEAERYPDTWTEQEDGSWRKGRWVARPGSEPGNEWITHDDFGTCAMSFLVPDLAEDSSWAQRALSELDDFLAHLKATEFVPQDVPEEGRWIRAELWNGRVVEGEVEETRKSGWEAFEFVAISGDSSDYYINLVEDAAKNPNDILDWSYIDPPQPKEPTGLGAVVEVNGIRWVRADDSSLPWRQAWAVDFSSWAGLMEIGPITVLSEGVEA